MKIIVLLILIIICYVLFCDRIVENANNIANDKYDNIYTENNCCTISKKLVPDNYMVYQYNISEDCPRNYSNNHRSIFSDEMVNGEKLDMNQCNSESNLFGSCRKMGGFECLDFITKKDCDNFSYMVWSKESCNTPIPTKITYPDWLVGINGKIRIAKSDINYSD